VFGALRSRYDSQCALRRKTEIRWTLNASVALNLIEIKKTGGHAAIDHWYSCDSTPDRFRLPSHPTIIEVSSIPRDEVPRERNEEGTR
jgi:hypothetical protein